MGEAGDAKRRRHWQILGECAIRPREFLLTCFVSSSQWFLLLFSARTSANTGRSVNPSRQDGIKRIPSLARDSIARGLGPGMATVAAQILLDRTRFGAGCFLHVGCDGRYTWRIGFSLNGESEKRIRRT